MIRLSSLAALMGTALLTMTAQPQDAAAQSSECYYTYSVWITDPDNPGRQRVQQYRMPRELAGQMYALGILLQAGHQQRRGPLPNPFESIDEPQTGGVRLPLGIEGIERIELVGGTFPGARNIADTAGETPANQVAATTDGRPSRTDMAHPRLFRAPALPSPEW